MRVVVRGGTVVAFRDGRHEVAESADVACEDGAIVEVGPVAPLPGDRVVDARGRLVIPGLVNTHCHVTDTPFTHGWLEDQGARDLDNLYRVLPAVRAAIGAEDELAAAERGFVELLGSGTTTVFEMGYDDELREGSIETTRRMVAVAERVGLRVYLAPRYRSCAWGLGPDGVRYRWFPDRGRARFEACVQFVRECRGAAGGRVWGALAPGQVDTCDAELLEATREAAADLRAPIQLHAGQSAHEFREIRRRHGVTTVALLEKTRLLGADFILGHGLYLSESGRVDDCAPDDLRALVETRATIAHCPVVKARQGTLMDSFGKYRRAGVRMSLGTDTFPQDMLNEMRWAAITCKLAERDPGATTAREVFDAATLGGADALGRADLGRVAPGARADLVLLDVRGVDSVPLRDVFKHLVYTASARDVRTVLVDGRVVVDDGQPVHVDAGAVARRMTESARRVWSRVQLT